MSIIGRVERKNWKVKFLNIMIHVVLIIGAATMVYPLLLMLSGSVKSAVDFKDFTVIPEYIGNGKESRKLLFRKYLYTKYNGNTLRMAAAFREPEATFDNVMPPAERETGRLISDYKKFLELQKKERPHYWFCIGMAFEQGIDTLSVRNYREYMQTCDMFSGDSKKRLQQINDTFGTKFEAWDELSLPNENFFPPRSSGDYSHGILATVLKFKYSQYVPPMVQLWEDLEGQFMAMLRRPEYGGTLKAVNRKLGTEYNSWHDIILDETVPVANPALATAWTAFVKEEINLDFVRIDTELGAAPWQAYLQNKYRNINALNKTYSSGEPGKNYRYESFADVPLSAVKPVAGIIRTDWQDFVRGNSVPEKMWIDFLKKEYSLEQLNERYCPETPFRKYSDVPFPDEYRNNSRLMADYHKLMAAVKNNWNRELPAEALRLDTLAIRYRKWLEERYAGSIANFNNAVCNGISRFENLHLTEEPAGETNLKQSADWLDFVRTLPPEHLSLHRNAAANYRLFLLKRYSENGTCNYDKLSETYGPGIVPGNENTIPVYLSCPPENTGKIREDYLAAVSNPEFENMLQIDNPRLYDQAWRDFLREKYGSPAQLNAAWKLQPSGFTEITLPVKQYEWNMLEENAPFLKNEYLTRNYKMVFSTLFTNGNAALNTLIYCFLAVLAALLVNPLCAYGLSRYKPASSYKILLFLMLPMAFPGMVLGIPQFLLIKNFGLLNTFAALILPGMASGYSIFLLKGFFDSLPKELFESAAIDGASEWTIFWHIAMGLSTPILSVIALGAFTAAYGNFMLAFLLCQNKSMWTMMVYLYQLQQRASPAVGFAALAIAAVPTLLVFIFCQNIIIKGIVVPTEK